MRDPRFYPRPHDPHNPDEAYLHEHDDNEPFEQGFVPPRERTDDHADPQPVLTSPCPKCESSRVEARHRARRTGGAIGTLAGTTSGIALALSGAETGAAAGSLAGPAGALCGAIAGAVIAGLVVGAAGCAAGSAFGEIVDDKVFDNFICHACGQPTITLPESDIARLRRDIESGAVKPTVAGIRRHLSCSQARASSLRRQLAELTA